MKSKLVTLCLGLMWLQAMSQDPRVIIRESTEACLSAVSGQYEMIRRMKYMSGPDTSMSRQSCRFSRLPADTIYQAAFHYSQPIDSIHRYHVFYSGENFVTYSEKDSNGRIMNRSLWADEIDQYKHNYDLYDPLIRSDVHPLPNEEELADSSILIQYVGTENMNGVECHHIQVNHLPEDEPDEPMKTLRTEYHLWINASDLIPVGYSTAFDLVMNNDTMYQYERFQLERYAVKSLADSSVYTLASIPSYVVLKDYTPYKAPPLLPLDTIAPMWALPSMDDLTMSLDALRGKVILIDFFYKSCYPCMLALPALQALHEKYAEQGLVVIGIDPFDTKEELGDFLTKRGVTYPILLEGKQASKDYRVSGYPTVYIVNQAGKIVLAESGYGEGHEITYEDIITSLLK